jgi:hypothetical protein
MADFTVAKPNQSVVNETTYADVNQFTPAFNSRFNEQFNKDFQIQEQVLKHNPKFLRTRQSLEAERRNVIGAISDNAKYNLYQENTLKPTTFRKQATTGQLECNLLNQVFFSQENIDLLQERLRHDVWIASEKKFVIDRQSDLELQFIMRSIYYQYGKNLPYNIKEQIIELNDLVIQECVPRILSQVEQHVYYLFDASTQPVPLSLPESMSSAGRKQLPSVTTTFFN